MPLKTNLLVLLSLAGSLVDAQRSIETVSSSCRTVYNRGAMTRSKVPTTTITYHRKTVDTVYMTSTDAELSSTTTGSGVFLTPTTESIFTTDVTTTTTTPATTTIAPSATQTPISSATENPQKLIKRVQHPKQLVPDIELAGIRRAGGRVPAVHPVRVTCTETLLTHRSTITSTTTTTTFSSTLTITTPTSTGPTTVATTTVTTGTNTVTEEAPTPTFYAACDATQGYIIDQVNGQPIQSRTTSRNLVMNSVSVTSAYDCCVACQTLPNGACLFSEWDALKSDCYYYTGNVVYPQIQFFSGTESLVYDNLTFANGPKLNLAYGGVQCHLVAGQTMCDDGSSGP